MWIVPRRPVLVVGLAGEPPAHDALEGHHLGAPRRASRAPRATASAPKPGTDASIAAGSHVTSAQATTSASVLAPERRHRRQHAALVGDGLGHHDVERAQAVRRDEEQPVARRRRRGRGPCRVCRCSRPSRVAASQARDRVEEARPVREHPVEVERRVERRRSSRSTSASASSTSRNGRRVRGGLAPRRAGRPGRRRRARARGRRARAAPTGSRRARGSTVLQVLPRARRVDDEAQWRARWRSRRRYPVSSIASGRTTRSTGAVRDVALVPERDVLEPGDEVAAHDPREPAQPLGADGVALVRHRRGALLPLGERLGDLARRRCARAGRTSVPNASAVVAAAAHA